MAIKKITRRWLLNSFGVIVVIIAVVATGAGFGVYNYYYSSVRQTLFSRADAADTMFTRYAEDRTQDYLTQVRGYVSGFAAKDRIEMMVMDDEGGVLYTSSGFVPDAGTLLDDYHSAAAAEDSRGSVVGEISGQRVMAVTLFLSLPGDSVTAVRFLTALTRVDRQIAVLVTAIAVLGVIILLLVLFSSSYFISSIVNPVGEVGETARKIALGDFAARLTKKNNDEIGELCDVINYMAEELGSAETMKNDFISSVSHELRTPLTAIQGWGETILSDGGDDRQTLQKGMRVIISETDPWWRSF